MAGQKTQRPMHRLAPALALEALVETVSLDQLVEAVESCTGLDDQAWDDAAAILRALLEGKLG